MGPGRSSSDVVCLKQLVSYWNFVMKDLTEDYYLLVSWNIFSTGNIIGEDIGNFAA